MNDDEFREMLRADAVGLRYEPGDEVVFTRLAARIRQRTVSSATTSVAGLLSRWLRPVAAALALASALSVFAAWTEARRESIDGYTSAAEVAVAAEDPYRVIE